jgi:Xaa-Pro dipeptidase
MKSNQVARVIELQRRLADANISAAVVSDPDSIFYLSGYWGYAGMSAGRPTFLWVPRTGESVVVTPLMELEMCQGLSSIGDIRPWMDGLDGEWAAPLRGLIRKDGMGALGIEVAQIPGIIMSFLHSEWPELRMSNIAPVLADMRMAKTASELMVMRQAGEVAGAMVEAAVIAIDVGVPEYEVSLAIIAAGTRRAASFLEEGGAERFFSPMIHNLQVLQSGHDTCMVHRRPTRRRIMAGDPIYLCFCGMANLKGYWLGFDREFFVRSVTDEQAKAYEVVLKAQAAAIAAIRPGVVAEDVHFAAEAVYRDAGFAPTYRTGRGTGCSILEPPEFKSGDKTRLREGMTFAVDGGITVPGKFGARVGDTIVVTNTGSDHLTCYPKALRIL